MAQARKLAGNRAVLRALEGRGPTHKVLQPALRDERPPLWTRAMPVQRVETQANEESEQGDETGTGPLAHNDFGALADNKTAEDVSRQEKLKETTGWHRAQARIVVMERPTTAGSWTMRVAAWYSCGDDEPRKRVAYAILSRNVPPRPGRGPRRPSSRSLLTPWNASSGSISGRPHLTRTGLRNGARHFCFAAMLKRSASSIPWCGAVPRAGPAATDAARVVA